MVGTGDPNILVGELALAGIAAGVVWRYFIWFRDKPRTPDPWDEDIEKKVNDPDTVEICHRCFTPVPAEGWFCKRCGSAVGPYNNLMPFVYVFSEGEVLRNGVNDRMRARPLIIIGYLLLSMSACLVLWRWLGPFCLIFALSYWFSMLRNLKRREEEQQCETEVTSPDSPP
jgi:transposase InsO family protein